MRDKDIILYNKVNKIERDLSSVGGGEFDPSTLPLDTEYFYESFMYKGLSNLSSSTTASYLNFTPSVGAVSGGTPSFGIDLATVGSTSIYKPYIRVAGSSLGGYFATFVGMSASLTNMTFNYGTNLEITYKTTISINNFLTNRDYSIGLGFAGQASGTLNGNGVYLKISKDTNSGNFQICQLKGGVVTAINTNVTIGGDTRGLIKIVFNTQTNIALFYFDEVLLGQVTVDISSTTIRPFYHIQSKSTAQTLTSSLYIHNIFMQLKYL